MKTSSFIFVLLLFLVSDAIGGGAAPYTEEAYKKLDAAAALQKPEFDPNLSKEERTKKGIDFWRNTFEKAGYNYEATIVKIADDMKNYPDRIPKGKITTFNIVIIGLHFIWSHCNQDKVDCLSFFDPDTAQAVKFLMTNTEFKL